MRNIVEIPGDVKKAVMVVLTDKNKVTAYPVKGDVEVQEMATMAFGCFVVAVQNIERLMENDEFTKEIGVNPMIMMREAFKVNSLEKILADWNFATNVVKTGKE